MLPSLRGGGGWRHVFKINQLKPSGRESTNELAMRQELMFVLGLGRRSHEAA